MKVVFGFGKRGIHAPATKTPATRKFCEFCDDVTAPSGTKHRYPPTCPKVGYGPRMVVTAIVTVTQSSGLRFACRTKSGAHRNAANP